eukprot:1247294-Alexandrium_andersonii.AAC.1
MDLALHRHVRLHELRVLRALLLNLRLQLPEPPVDELAECPHCSTERIAQPFALRGGEGHLRRRRALPVARVI